MGVIAFPGGGANDAGDNGGEPPDMTSMNERLAVLETRWEAAATKSDREQAKNATEKAIGDLRSDMHKGFTTQVQWIVGAALALGAAGITVMTFVLNNAVPKSVPTQVQAPVVVQLPPQVLVTPLANGATATIAPPSASSTSVRP